jgi:hypothetical protein
MQRLGETALLVDADDRACKGKMIRVANLALTEWPANAERPREIYCYAVEGEKYFKLDPAKLLYCLQWQHRGHPPDFHLQLVKDEPELWVHFVNAALLGELQKQDPHLLDGLHAG